MLLKCLLCLFVMKIINVALIVLEKMENTYCASRMQSLKCCLVISSPTNLKCTLLTYAVRHPFHLGTLEAYPSSSIILTTKGGYGNRAIFINYLEVYFSL